MLYRGHQLNWDSPMPTSPLGQRHESPSTGDNVGAFRRAKGKPLDVKITRLAGRNWALHYPTPGPNGYTLVVVARSAAERRKRASLGKAYGNHWHLDPETQKVRRMSALERRRHGDKWGVSGIQRWRRPNGERPCTEWFAIRECVRLGTLAIRELKSPAMGTNADGAEESMAVSHEHNHPAWFKTLYNMRNPRGKVLLYQSKGGQVALIFGKAVSGRARRLVASRRIQSSWGTVRAHATW